MKNYFFSEEFNNISFQEFIILTCLVIVIYIGALKKQKLTFGGANSAIIIGTIMSIADFEYLFIMASFFVSSIKATSYNKKIKEKHLGISYKKESKRNAAQVLAKGFLPTIISIIIYYFYGGKLLLFSNNIDNKLKFLYGSFIGFFISANADTWASELGIASKNNPIFIINFQTVPKGVNGGISLLGTIMSIIGGLFISFCSLIFGIIRELLFNKNNIFNLDYSFYNIFIILFIGALGGFLGSGIDSIIGATLQISIFDMDKEIIINKNELKNINISEAKLKKDKYKIYGRDFLNNTQVNFITGTIMSFICGFLFVLMI